MAACSMSRLYRGVFQRKTLSALADSFIKKRCNDILVSRNIWSSSDNSSNVLHGSTIRICGLQHARNVLLSTFLPCARSTNSQYSTSRLTECFKRRSLFRFRTSVQYSTAPDGKRLRHLMIATYVSAAFGVVLLTAVAARFYGRFKKRARGIEDLDIPLYGRRNRVLCRYRGYSLPSLMVDTVIDDVPWFEVKPDDVWVLSFPKAGTTWVQEAVYLICNDCDFEKARAANLDQRFPFLEYPFPGLREIAKMDSPRFIKSHLPFSLLPKQMEEKKPKVIYVARNPKDTAVSLRAFVDLVNYFRFTGTMDDFAQLFLEGSVTYGPWVKHVQEALAHRNDDNVLFITYEDLHKDFRGTVESLARFLGKALTDAQITELEEHCRFRSMRTNDRVNYSWMKGLWKDGQFMRKGEVGDWKHHLSPSMAAKFDAMATSLEPQGVQFLDG